MKKLDPKIFEQAAEYLLIGTHSIINSSSYKFCCCRAISGVLLDREESQIANTRYHKFFEKIYKEDSDGAKELLHYYWYPYDEKKLKETFEPRVFALLFAAEMLRDE